jgi:hypothetical protein
LYRSLGGPVWAGAENLATIAIRSPNRQVRSESLYRLVCSDMAVSEVGEKKAEKVIRKKYEAGR